MIAVQRRIASILAAAAISAVDAAQPSPRSATGPSTPAPAKAVAAAAAATPAPAGASSASSPITRSARFTQLGAKGALQLRGDGSVATLDFGARSDELVTRATLRFRYLGSPALQPGISHIRLSLNGDVIGTLPFSAATAGTLVERALEIDPRLLIGFNKLTMTLVAAEGGDAPADAARPGLWADVTAASELELTLQPLALADDLAILPEPFFDSHDQRRVVVPFAFGAKPSNATLRAASVVASWLGQHARWRGVRTPVSFDAPAAGHSIAFAANDERPAFLAALPPANGPALRFMSNPADPRAKLLVLMGRDAADLKAAADALASGLPMSGASVQVKAVADKGAVPAYEAPAWAPLDRPVKLGDLIDWPQQLEASGRPPQLDAVHVDVRVPPDLATWRGPGVPLVLKLQYTPPACAVDAYVEVSVNGQLIESQPLRLASQPIVETKEAFIPYYRLRARNDIGFAFRFPVRDEPACHDPRAPPIKAVVLPESTIDFSGFPHYVRMPNLAHFASVGFPFTRRPDLAETVVVLPDEPVAADVETLLALMARMGEATGRAATRVRIARAKDTAALEDADLLVLGSTFQQPLLKRWSENMPIAFTANMQRVSRSVSPTDQVFDWLGLAAPLDTTVATQVSFEGTGPTAAIHAFESPVTRGRSVVVVTALAPEQLHRVIDALDDRDMGRAIRGSAAFVMRDRVDSVLVGPTYHVGRMPPWTGLGYWLSQRPELVGGALTLLLAALGFAAYLVRNRFVAWRMRRRGA